MVKSQMKKKLILLIIGIIGVFIFIQYQRYAHRGKVDEVVLEFGNSKKFSRKEIHDAMLCVLEEFESKESFKECRLERLYYDESVSDREFGSDNTNGIVLLCDYYSESYYGNREPDTRYGGYGWILVRDSKTSKWELRSSGYA